MNTKEGMPFVDFSVESENGTVSLSDYVGKGKYVLADFWASWCTPCIDEMPHLKELYKKYSGSNFTVLGIACYDSPKSSLEAIDANKLPWPQILGSGEAAAKAYGVRGIPFFILFAPDGTILSRGQYGEALDKVVEENLDCDL
ncbi:MAG: TlpA family protein disulfide reductase [Bacteroidales bacterium]|nr:TlpA family protein disulfide reductase [Bacteroidales bacterium]